MDFESSISWIDQIAPKMHRFSFGAQKVRAQKWNRSHRVSGPAVERRLRLVRRLAAAAIMLRADFVAESNRVLMLLLQGNG